MAASEHSAAAEVPGITPVVPGPAAQEVVGFSLPGTQEWKGVTEHLSMHSQGVRKMKWDEIIGRLGFA